MFTLPNTAKKKFLLSWYKKTSIKPKNNLKMITFSTTVQKISELIKEWIIMLFGYHITWESRLPYTRCHVINWVVHYLSETSYFNGSYNNR